MRLKENHGKLEDNEIKRCGILQGKIWEAPGGDRRLQKNPHTNETKGSKFGVLIGQRKSDLAKFE